MTNLIKFNVENFSRSVPESTSAQISALGGSRSERDARVGRHLQQSVLLRLVRLGTVGCQSWSWGGGLLVATTASLWSWVRRLTGYYSISVASSQTALKL